MDDVLLNSKSEFMQPHIIRIEIEEENVKMNFNVFLINDLKDSIQYLIKSGKLETVVIS